MNAASTSNQLTHRAVYETGSPKFSIIIPVYQDWNSLNECLKSIIQQTNAPPFEIIIVDDGSKDDIPEFICEWKALQSIRIIRQLHAGIAAARNRGIHVSAAPICVFVDSDCRLHPNCLQMLERSVDASPDQHYFQLHLTGGCGDGLVGKTEELRLRVVQRQYVRPGGAIRYLNTAAFAFRRNEIDSSAPLFNPIAVRAEDTLLLANLISAGKLPLFVPEAMVQHIPPLSLMAYLVKAMRSGYLEGLAFDVISASNIEVRSRHQERLRMLKLAWLCSAEKSIGRIAWFVLLTRQTLRLLSGFCYQRLHHKVTCSLRFENGL